MSTQFCDYCRQKPKLPNHQYCSKMCAGIAAQVQAQNPATITTLCGYCHNKHKYQNLDYCSKTCADNHKKLGGGSSNCDVCHINPKWNDGMKIHPFCSKTCANASRVASGGTKTPGCQAPGCQKSIHVDPSGLLSEYCSSSHKAIGETLCLMCFQAVKRLKSHFCSQACEDEAERKGPMMLEVPIGHVTFTSVEDQFRTSWRQGIPCPRVRRIYKICSSASSIASYNVYREKVEARGQFTKSGRYPGNENRRWHGTRRKCNVGDDGQAQLCSSQTCFLCSVIRTSFDMTFFGKKTGCGRFGKGIYTTSTSSNSNAYSQNTCASKFKVLLLNKVVVGRGCKMLHDHPALISPPLGYDSVIAEKGGSVSYDELVVFTNDAIRPSFLVVYDEP